MKEMFIFTRFNRKSHLMIQAANEIIEEYMKSGLVLTLRQLYYQFVARDLIPNKQSEYKNLGNLISRGRLSGYIDWDAIEDRTRALVRNPHWDSPADILDACVRAYAIDKWETQPYYVEVWIEKEALAGVIQSICAELDVPHFACRGYVSQSEMFWGGKRLKKKIDAGQEVVILHLGDHDPSGLDMTRDIQERLDLFIGEGNLHSISLKRIALNMNQIKRYSPPPNPAKTSDSRFKDYYDRHGHESWELDALDPKVLQNIISKEVGKLRDQAAWEEAVKKQSKGISQLIDLTDQAKDMSDLV